MKLFKCRRQNVSGLNCRSTHSQSNNFYTHGESGNKGHFASIQSRRCQTCKEHIICVPINGDFDETYFDYSKSGYPFWYGLR